MREFTKTEKEVVRKLIEWCSDDQSIRLGEVLLRLFPKIEYIKPSNKKEDEFYKHTIEISYNIKQGSLSDILEAINLFDLLVKQNYIVVKQLFTTECIGEERQGLYSNIDEVHYVKTSIINYYQYDLWEFLCSYFYVTNALVDFAKDFKTVEQRRYEKQLKVANDTLMEAKMTLVKTRQSFNVAIAALIVSIIFGVYQSCSQQEINSEQINTIISAVKEQKSISIDKFLEIIPDTLNVKVTEVTNKLPINLNVTLKDNQPTKIK